MPAAPAFEADVKFERIRVADGTLAVADPQSGYTFVLDHVDLDADAGSLAGPFKLSGASGPRERRTRFRLATGEMQKNQAHARLIVDETPAHAGVDLDGTLRLRGAKAGESRQGFDGTFAVAGHLADLSEDPVAWKLTGHLAADTAHAALDAGELRVGGEDASVTFQATGTGDFEDKPTLALALSAKQLDLDRLSGAPVDAVKPPPPKLPDLATLRRVLASAAPPIRTQVDLEVDNVTYGGDAFSDVAAHVVFGGAAAEPLKLAADGPGGSHVAIDGTLAPALKAGGGPSADGPTFRGAIDLGADNLPRALNWLHTVDPSLPTNGHLGIDSFALKGRVVAGRNNIASDSLAVSLDRSVLKGPVRVAFGDASRAPKISADLRAEKLDLAGLPGLDALRDPSGAFDFDLHVGAKTVTVARLGDGSLDSGRVDLVLAKTGRDLTLKSFRADDLGGASIAATGRLDPQGGALTASVDAARVDAAAALIAKLLPGAASQALVDRAPALAPAKIKIDAGLASGNGGALAASRLSITGTLGATRLDIATKPGEAGATAVSADLTSPDGNALLRQLGVATLPIEAIGAARIDLTAHGHPGDPLETKLAARLGTTRIDATGAFDVLSLSPRGSGQLHVASPDVAPLLQSLAVAFPDLTGRLPLDLSSGVSLGDDGVSLQDIKAHLASIGATGAVTLRHAAGSQPALTGTLDLDRLAVSDLFGLALGPAETRGSDAGWSRQPFTVGLVDPPRSALTLRAKSLEVVSGLVAHDASLELGIAQNLVTLDKIAADLDGGRIDGGVSLRRDGSQATVEGNIALDHVAIALPALDTTLSGRLDLAGGGGDAAALVASLAGSGTATATGLAIHGGDPAALPKVFADVESDVLAVDQESIAKALSDAGRAPLPLGTRQFSLGLAAGVLHFDPKDPEPVTTGDVSSKASATFDLAAARLDTQVEQTLNALPNNWTGAPPVIVMRLAGPIAKPARTYDVSGFVDAVAARALARETARIEAYEFDIRERAFFNARLQSERRREADRLKAEDDARKAEAERKARRTRRGKPSCVPIRRPRPRGIRRRRTRPSRTGPTRRPRVRRLPRIGAVRRTATRGRRTRLPPRIRRASGATRHARNVLKHPVLRHLASRVTPKLKVLQNHVVTFGRPDRPVTQAPRIDGRGSPRRDWRRRVPHRSRRPAPRPTGRVAPRAAAAPARTHPRARRLSDARRSAASAW